MKERGLKFALSITFKMGDQGRKGEQKKKKIIAGTSIVWLLETNPVRLSSIGLNLFSTLSPSIKVYEAHEAILCPTNDIKLPCYSRKTYEL